MSKISNFFHKILFENFFKEQNELLLSITKNQSKLLEELSQKIKDIPEGLCWMCSGGLKRWKGCIGWNGRWFCTEECLQRFHQLNLRPDEDYKSLPDKNGVYHRIEVIKPDVKN